MRGVLLLDQVISRGDGMTSSIGEVILPVDEVTSRGGEMTSSIGEVISSIDEMASRDLDTVFVMSAAADFMGAAMGSDDIGDFIAPDDGWGRLA